MLHRLFDGHPDINNYPVDLSLLYAYLPCQKANLSCAQIKERINLVLRKATLEIRGKNIPFTDVVYNCEDFLEKFWSISTPSQLDNPEIVIRTIVRAWCEYVGLDIELPFVLKETSQGIHAFRIIESGLPVKFINLIRDPRDNYAAIKSGISRYYAKIGEDEKTSLASVINRARMDLLVSSQLDERYPEKSLSIRFEDLTRDPSNTMKQISSFCGVSFRNSLLDPTLFGESFAGNSHRGEKFSGISDSNVGQWRSRISSFEAGVIEFWMSDVMDRWGYDVSLSKTEAAKHFAQFYDWYNCYYYYYDSFSEKA